VTASVSVSEREAEVLEAIGADLSNLLPVSRGGANVTLMDTLGDDLVLLAIRQNGVIAPAATLQYGLSGSELVRLAALRRVDIEDGRIVVLDKAPTGDALLDEALVNMYRGWREPIAIVWVAQNRDDLVRRYLERLAAAGTIQLERRKALGLLPVNGWTVLDAGRLAAARSRLDAVAYGTGGVDMAQAALAGLAMAIGLPPLIYRGLGGAAARRRIRRAVSSSGSAEMTHAVSTSAADTPDAATCTAADAAARAVTDAAVQASIGAATQAAVSAATQAAVSAATQAAMSAATQAAVSASTHAAHGGGHAGGYTDGHH
jgi:hypothetical protein